MGDEPSFNIPWEYDYAGDPSGTEHVVREIQDDLYTDSPGGLAGNDDLGATSSWYVWSALGAYPEMPGSAVVALGSPLFDAIALHLGNGATITETAPGAADDSPYVQGLSLNGTAWNGAYLPASVFTSGGTLDWTLGSTPDPTWAAAAADAPPSNTEGLLPALGYLPEVENSGVTVAPGASTALTFGVQSMTAGAERIEWTATVPAGSGLGGASTGALTVAGEAKTTQSIAVAVPAGTAAGAYLVTFSLTTPTGTALPDLVAEVDVS